MTISNLVESSLTRHVGAGQTETAGEPAGWRWALAMLGGSALLAAAGGAQIVEFGFPVLAVLVAARLLARKAYTAYLEVALWTWFVTPGLRRIVDLHTGYHGTSPILLTAPLVSLLVLATAGRWQRRVDRSVAILVGGSAAVYGYSVIVGLASSGPTAVAAGVADWVTPFVLGAAVLLLPLDDGNLRALLTRVVRSGLLILGGYAIAQWALAPAWDVQWLKDVSLVANSFGRGQAFAIRAFSSVNSPGPFAAVIGWMLILHAGLPRWRWGWLATAVGLVGLGLSEVRSAWLVTALALLLVVWRGRFRLARGLVTLAVALVAVLTVGGPLLSTLQSRADTVTSGSTDQSFSARLTFQRTVLPSVLRDPVGGGIGATGAGARQAGDSDLANTDSGYVSAIAAFGSVPGVLLLAAILAASFTVYRRSRQRDGLLVAAAALSATVPVSLLFGSELTSVSGVVSWLGLAVCGRWLPTGPSVIEAGDLSSRQIRADPAREAGFASPITWRTE